MKFKTLDQGSFVLIFDKGDEFIEALTSFAREKKLGGSHFTAIGAFRDVMLGYFDREMKKYKQIPIVEQVEVLSLVGDIALKDNSPKSTRMSCLEKRMGPLMAVMFLKRTSGRLWKSY